MKKILYAVINPSKNSLENKLIGFHEKKKVVTQYYYSLKALNDGGNYKLVKIHKSLLKKIPNFYDYILVRFGRNYIPEMYYSMAKADLDTIVCEYKFVIEVLSRIFELEELPNKKKNALEKTILMIQELLNEEMDCTLSPKQMDEIMMMYNSFRNDIIMQDQLNDDEWVPFFDEE